MLLENCLERSYLDLTYTCLDTFILVQDVQVFPSAKIRQSIENQIK